MALGHPRYTEIVGTIGSGGLTNSATSHTFTAPLTYGGGSTVVPTLSGTDFFLLTILTTAGLVSEVVKVTAYNSSTGAATIARGQEGTTGVSHSSGDKVTGSVYPSDLDDSGWITPTMLNSWVSFDGDTTYGEARYRKKGGVVYIDGVIKSGAINTTMFTLPAGYRPRKQKIVVTYGQGGLTVLLLFANGDIQANVLPSNAYVSLDSIHPFVPGN